MQELWCLTGPVIYEGEVKYEDFCGIRFFPGGTSAGKAEWEIARQKEEKEGHCARGDYGSDNKGVLNFNSCSLFMFSRHYEGSEHEKVMKSFFWEKFRRRVKINLGRLQRELLEIIGEIYKLEREERTPDEFESRDFKTTIKDLSVILNFTDNDSKVKMKDKTRSKLKKLCGNGVLGKVKQLVLELKVLAKDNESPMITEDNLQRIMKNAIKLERYLRK